MGLKAAKTIASVPRASPPRAGRSLGASGFKNWAQLRLSPSQPEAPDAARLPAASVAGVPAQISSSNQPLRRSAAGFHEVRWKAQLPPRESIGGLKLPSLQGAPAYVRGLSPAEAFARARRPDVDSRPEVRGGASRLAIHAPVILPAPAGLRALQDAFPVSIDTLGPDSMPEARQRCARPYPFPVTLGLFTVESGGVAPNADRNYFGELSLSRNDAGETAGFAHEELYWPAPSGFSGALYVACDFTLYPVWLPALFDAASGVQAGLGCGAISQPAPRPLRSCEDLLPTDGPGFSGTLACPTPGAVCRDSRETRKPEEVIVSEHVSEPTPLSELAAQSEHHPPAESPWQPALRAWRQTPAWARCVALVVPLAVPALFYGPKLSLPGKSPGAGTGAWAAAIKARAAINLEDDFQAGLASWNGKPGWEKTWSIDRSGSAQPGRVALYSPTIPLTDYRFEFQGQILAKALGIALRAKDTNNYQAVKIGVSKPGPLSSLTFARYPVIEGREGPRMETAIPLTVQNDTLYKLVVAIQADHFTVTVNGVFADAWTEARFPAGGIGFFADKGESARVRSIHVIDKDDFLGRLCYQVSQWTADRPTIGAKHE